MKIQKFYLYKPLTTLDHFSQLKNYINQKVWLSKLCDLNDPFEGNFIYQPSATPSQILNDQGLFEQRLSLFRIQRPELTQEVYRMELLSLPSDTPCDSPYFCDDFFKDFGAICFNS